MADLENASRMIHGIAIARRRDTPCPICERLREHCSCHVALNWVLKTTDDLGGDD